MKKMSNNSNTKNFHFLDDLRSVLGRKIRILANNIYEFENYEALRMVYMAHGTGIIKFNKKAFVIRSHDIFLFFPNTIIRLQQPPQQIAWSFIGAICAAII